MATIENFEDLETRWTAGAELYFVSALVRLLKFGSHFFNYRILE